jgi:hypothetical protein
MQRETAAIEQMHKTLARKQAMIEAATSLLQVIALSGNIFLILSYIAGCRHIC